MSCYVKCTYSYGRCLLLLTVYQLYMRHRDDSYYYTWFYCCSAVNTYLVCTSSNELYMSVFSLLSYTGTLCLNQQTPKIVTTIAHLFMIFDKEGRYSITY